MSLFVTAAAGTERALKDELLELRFFHVKGDRGGVRLAIPPADAVARICLGSRIAVRVLMEVASFPCPDEDALYEGVSAIEWERWLTPASTLGVSAVSRNSRLTHTGYIAQRTKDAVVDRQRARQGTRSSVDRHDPDLSIFVHLAKDQAGIFLDASGQSLHLRGWRASAGAAPLKETLAAAIVRLSGWDRVRPFVDPLCGSGTLPIEADLLARRVPPQATSRRFGFERWADHDEAAARRMVELRAETEARALSEGPRCLGSDQDARVIATARGNAEKARSRARFEVGRLEDLVLTEPSHVVANPPYGVRLEVDRAFERALRAALPRLEGHAVTLLLPDPVPRGLLPKGAREHALFNGRLRCRLVSWGA